MKLMMTTKMSNNAAWETLRRGTGQYDHLVACDYCHSTPPGVNMQSQASQVATLKGTYAMR